MGRVLSGVAMVLLGGTLATTAVLKLVIVGELWRSAMSGDAEATLHLVALIAEVSVVGMLWVVAWRRVALVATVMLFTGASGVTLWRVLQVGGHGPCRCLGRVSVSSSQSLVMQGAVLLLAGVALRRSPRADART